MYRSRVVLASAVVALAAMAEPRTMAQNAVLDFVVQAPVEPADAIGPADAANDTPQQAALRRQLEPLLKIELSFANRICHWTPEERRKTIGEAKTWLREFARDNANNNMLNRGMMVFAGAQPAGVANQGGGAPETSLRNAIAKGMTAEQRPAYDAERKKREDFRVAAIVENIVTQIDQRLNLTPDQRKKITDSLTTMWSDDWAPPLELFVQMSEYLPAFPDELVLTHLTREQVVAWQGIQKISARGIAFGGGIMGAGQPIDDIDLNEAK